MTNMPLSDGPMSAVAGGPPGLLDRFGGVYAALLPLRAFLGFTFVYAGLDKFATDGFLQATGPGSIGEQLEAFTRASPLTPLIEAFAIPNPVAIGTLMALAEIAIGLGILTGLLYRAAAAAGALTALTLWLTASWTTTPYYYGPDLPVMFGFITLALAGNGGLLVAGNLVPRRRPAPGVSAAGTPVPTATSAVVVGRREVLQAAALGIATVALGAAARLLFGGEPAGSSAGDGGAGPGRPSPAPGAGSTPASTAGVTPAPGAGATPPGASTGPTPTPGATPAGQVIGNVDEIATGEAVTFAIPSTGDPAAAIKLADGRVVAYDLVCTHEGCTVGYDEGPGILRCPCHGATFDPSADGRVLGGPARRPLPTVPLVIDPATGSISLAP